MSSSLRFRLHAPAYCDPDRALSLLIKDIVDGTLFAVNSTAMPDVFEVEVACQHRLKALEILRGRGFQLMEASTGIN